MLLISAYRTDKYEDTQVILLESLAYTNVYMPAFLDIGLYITIIH